MNKPNDASPLERKENAEAVRDWVKSLLGQENDIDFVTFDPQTHTASLVFTDESGKRFLVAVSRY